MARITELPYRNGLISQSFWFSETRMMVRMIAGGNTLAEARAEAVRENLFGMPNETRSKEVAQRIARRLQELDTAMIDLYMTSDVPTQKLINLVAILRLDRLFFEFIYEVYREKVMLGVPDLGPADINAFFSRKESESETVAAWQDVTKRRLRNSYLNFMTDAGLLSLQDKRYTITVPLMDVLLERKLIADGEASVVKALTGVDR